MKFVNAILEWLLAVITVNYDDKKCGLKEFNTTLGHIVLIGTLVSGSVSLVVASVYRPTPQLSQLVVPACIALVPLLSVFLLSIANLLYIVANFPAPNLSPAWCAALRILSYLAVLVLVYGLVGVSLSLFGDMISAKLPSRP